MERGAWTDERLDDLSRRMEAGFARVDERFTGVEAQMDVGFSRVDAELRELRTMMVQIGGAMVGAMLVGFLGVIAAILAGA